MVTANFEAPPAVKPTDAVLVMGNEFSVALTVEVPVMNPEVSVVVYVPFPLSVVPFKLPSV